MNNHTDSCNGCMNYSSCGWRSRSDIAREVFKSIPDYIKLIMNYRDHGHYSFRGQRNYKWKLGVDFRFSHDDTPVRIHDYIVHYKRRAMALPKLDNIPEDDEWRWLFHAQHHGLKTKLLDWTSNPLVALYFAVENIVSKQKDDVCGAVWALEVHSAFFLTPKEAGHPENVMEAALPTGRKPSDWYLVNPPPISSRIERQSGKFSYHPDTKKFVSDQEDNETRDRKLVLFCWCPNSRKNLISLNKKIRRHLGIMNIHHATMFPDHSGISQFLNYEFWDLQPIE